MDGSMGRPTAGRAHPPPRPRFAGSGGTKGLESDRAAAQRPPQRRDGRTDRRNGPAERRPPQRPLRDRPPPRTSRPPTAAAPSSSSAPSAGAAILLPAQHIT